MMAMALPKCLPTSTDRRGVALGATGGARRSQAGVPQAQVSEPGVVRPHVPPEGVVGLHGRSGRRFRSRTREEGPKMCSQSDDAEAGGRWWCTWMGYLSECWVYKRHTIHIQIKPLHACHRSVDQRIIICDEAPSMMRADISYGCSCAITPQGIL